MASHKKSRKKKARKVKVSPLVALAAAVAILLVLVLVLMPWNLGDGSETGAKIPPGNWRFGIDISHNNEGPIVWDSLFVMTDSRKRTVKDPYRAKDIFPVEFVFIKATEGASFKDSDFKKNWKEAGKSGLRRGAYHFFRSSKDGVVQARNFISTVGDMRYKDLPPVLDIETVHLGCSKDLLNRRALDWLRTVEKHYGKKPLVYASSSFIKDYLGKEIREGYPIWVAHYEKDTPSHKEWTYWQFTDKAIVKGVPGKVDLSVTPAD